MGEHSPGPWMWVQQLGDWHGEFKVLETADEKPLVAEVIGHSINPHREANRRLIADAPTTAAERDELLEAAGTLVFDLIARDWHKKGLPSFDKLCEVAARIRSRQNTGGAG